MRLQLYAEHFGLRKSEAADPLESRKLLAQIARRNTEIYREVFACYPDDNVQQIADLEEFRSTARPERDAALKSQIKGFAVEWPLRFMENENLYLSVTNKEYYIPLINFT